MSNVIFLLTVNNFILIKINILESLMIIIYYVYALTIVIHWNMSIQLIVFHLPIQSMPKFLVILLQKITTLLFCQ